MRYEMNFGAFGKAMGEVKPLTTERFRIAVLGDFSGRANKGELAAGDDLANRKGHKVDVDNLDDVIERFNIELDLPLAEDGGGVHVEIGSMDDFHPDELHDNLEVFEELSGLRQRLNNSSMFDGAAKEVMGWIDDDKSLRKKFKPAKTSRGSAIPATGKLSDFASLLGQPTGANVADTSADELIKRVVGPYVVPEADPRQEAMVAAVDEALSGLMRSVLHHPDFQTMEALWRGVDQLTRTLETSSALQLVLFDVTAEELAADLAGSNDLAETGLYRMLVEQPALDENRGPFSMVLGCYQFEQTPPHAELLGRMAKIVAQAPAAFVSSISNDCLQKVDEDEIHPLILESWGALRNMAEAKYLGLVVAKFMLRHPYGKKTDPIDPFDFEEFTGSGGLRSMLWGNPAFVATQLLGQCFTKQGLKGLKLGSIMAVGDMPFHYYVDKDGDQVALPCTDRIITSRVADHVAKQNFMPLLGVKGRPEVRMGGWTSIGGSDLAGPWAPVTISGDGGAAPSAAPEEEAPEAEAAAEEEPETVETEAEEDDLDALLASLEDDDDDDDGGGDDDDEELDPELAALLADL